MSAGYPFKNLLLCRAFTILGEWMAKAIDTDYELTVTQMMTKGNFVCEWVIGRG